MYIMIVVLVQVSQKSSAKDCRLYIVIRIVQPDTVHKDRIITLPRPGKDNRMHHKT